MFVYLCIAAHNMVIQNQTYRQKYSYTEFHLTENHMKISELENFMCFYLAGHSPIQCFGSAEERSKSLKIH